MATSTEALVASVAAKYDDGGGEGEALLRAALRRREERLRRGGKVCSRCNKDRPLSAFALDSRRSDGLAYVCRLCEAARAREGRRARVNVL